VATRFPALDELAAATEANARTLAPAYIDYLFGVSRWVVSLRLSALLFALCDVLAPRAILDLGSGFTTYVFRTYAAECADPPRIVSVDDSAEWLGKTSRFLAQHGFGDGEIMLLDDFLGREREQFDLVLHDLGDMNARARTLVEVLQNTGHGGVALLDDVNMPNYRRLVEQAAGRAGFTVHDLRDVTLDETGRFAWALERR